MPFLRRTAGPAPRVGPLTQGWSPGSSLPEAIRALECNACSVECAGCDWRCQCIFAAKCHRQVSVSFVRSLHLFTMAKPTSERNTRIGNCAARWIWPRSPEQAASGKTALVNQWHPALVNQWHPALVNLIPMKEWSSCRYALRRRDLLENRPNARNQEDQRCCMWESTNMRGN